MSDKESTGDDVLYEALAGKRLGIASIVYAALDGTIDSSTETVSFFDRDLLVIAVAWQWRRFAKNIRRKLLKEKEGLTRISLGCVLEQEFTAFYR
jgi:hypothetical protein